MGFVFKVGEYHGPKLLRVWRSQSLVVGSFFEDWSFKSYGFTVSVQRSHIEIGGGHG